MQTLLHIVIAIFIISCSHGAKDLSKTKESKDLDVKKFTLDNGLRLLVLENRKIPSLSYYTFYDVGGYKEEKKIFGGAHFLEHMMFKGSAAYPAGFFDSMVEGIGGVTNAYTTQEITVYHNNVPPSGLDLVASVEADRMSHLLLESNSFEKERAVILEEKKSRIDNSPYGKLYWELTKEVFAGTPYGRLLIGEDSDLHEITKESMMAFYHKYYSPNNAVVVVVGDVKADEVYKIIKDRYGKLSNVNTPSERVLDLKMFTTKERPQKRIKLMGSNPNPLFLISFPGAKSYTPNSYILDLVGAVLGDGESSYLNQQFVLSDKPLLSYVQAQNRSLLHGGHFVIGGELLANVTLKAVESKIVGSMGAWCNEAINDRSVAKVKNQLLISYYQSLETNSGLASLIGAGELMTGDYSAYKNELAIYEAITVEELKKVCLETFNKDRMVFASIENQKVKK